MNVRNYARWSGRALSLLVVTTILAACGESEPVDNSEFLADVRSDARPAAAEEGLGVLPPADGKEMRVPHIEVETDVFEMGTIVNDTTTERAMIVRNTGNAPLRIGAVTTTCHCTEGRMEPNVIPAGGEGKLLITVYPSRINGFYARKTLTLPTNDPRNQAVQIDVVSHVEPEFEWTAEEFAFGKVVKGETPELTYRLRQLQEAPMDILKLQMGAQQSNFVASFRVVDDSEWQTPGKREFDVSVRIAESAPAGNLRDHLELNLDVPRFSRFTFGMPVSAEIVSPYTLSTNRITLKAVESGRAYPDLLVITSDLPIEVVSVASNNPAVTVGYELQNDGRTATFGVTIAAGDDGRIQRDVITITTRIDGATYTDTIPLLAVLQKSS